jgi:hypothetical protein
MTRNIYSERNSDSSETVVRQVMEVPLRKVGQAVLALVGEFTRARGGAAKLRRFKQVVDGDSFRHKLFVLFKFRGH